jgi:hypothetical protein
MSADWPVVIVESPFSGDMEANRQYAIRACVDCLNRQEVPYASHLFFPQFLDELEPDQRKLGIAAGYAMWKAASKIVFYVDRGWSGGMRLALDRAIRFKVPYEDRSVEVHHVG